MRKASTYVPNGAGAEAFKGTVQSLIAWVKAVFDNGYKYAIVSHGLSGQNRNSTGKEPWPPKSMCDEYKLACRTRAPPSFAERALH